MKKLDTYQRHLVKKLFGYKKQSEFFEEVKNKGAIEKEGVTIRFDNNNVICELSLIYGKQQYLFN